MPNPLVSVVVPVYNTAAYLDVCIQSILSQSYTDIEVIAVDDGSTDDSLAKLQKYASMDGRMKVIHKSNGGLNSARCEGVKCCAGEWITFVDSDDSLCVNSIQTLLEASSDDFDIVVGYSFQDPNPPKSVSINDWRSELSKSNPILCTAWGKLYRYSVLSGDVFCLRYDDRIPAEDMPMNIKIAFHTEKAVKIIPNKVYNYTIRQSGLSKSAKWTLKMVGDLYGEVLCSIPEDKRDLFMSELIENRLISLAQLVLVGSADSSDRIGESHFLRALRNDIRSHKYRLHFREKLITMFPDSTMASIYLRVCRFLLIGRQFISRVLN